jgi:hypothetical protein
MNHKTYISKAVRLACALYIHSRGRMLLSLVHVTDYRASDETLVAYYVNQSRIMTDPTAAEHLATHDHTHACPHL